MSRFRALAALAAATALVLTGCAGTSAAPGAQESSAAADGAFPVTIEHAFGETTIEAEPTRVVTVAWGNQDAALALGVVPVAMPKVTWGDEDGDGLLPWVKDKLDELGAETPTLMDETNGFDYEAIADAQPDVILGAYSGMTQEQYDTLSKIAPVVAYPEIAWGTTWQEMTLTDGKALGREAQAEELVSDLEKLITDEAAQYPALAGLSTLFTYIDPTDLGTVGYYSLKDPRAMYLTEMGMTPSSAVETSSTDSETFWFTQSAENVEAFADVDALVGYGTDATLAQLQADPLWSRIPAVASGAVVMLPDNTSLAAAANPSPLSIGTPLGDEYIGLVGAAAQKAAS
ncbi:iron-siderophore ABC transporter substrate-binding protein [Microbacterium enclense]|uniref:iron-siderophore ABC transporter substrate-binding protein n=1 Tax=Microbacterium enclense TaxID=993073 RepID=UPI0021A92EFA|nr:iron-siderophore ABC transporter substrate-binding protein [Microbacterium enclense]MCT2087151.1 iron-siderophore ABC transporter substrate-binding protein [Microbacterium enclense]